MCIRITENVKKKEERITKNNINGGCISGIFYLTIRREEKKLKKLLIYAIILLYIYNLCIFIFGAHNFIPAVPQTTTATTTLH